MFETILMLALVLILGFGLGFIFARKSPIWSGSKTVGVLRVDTSDPDGPYMFLELHTGVSEVMGRKQVTLDVSTKNYISRK